VLGSIGPTVGNVIVRVKEAVVGHMIVDRLSVGIDLKELGGQLPKCLKFCPGIEI